MPTIGDALSLLEAELFVGRERELPQDDYSWMAFLAEAGLDVFVVDVTGYARDPPGAHGRPCCRRCCTSRTRRAARAC